MKQKPGSARANRNKVRLTEIYGGRKSHESFNKKIGLVSVSLVEIIHSTEILFEERNQKNSQEVLGSERRHQIKSDLTDK